MLPQQVLLRREIDPIELADKICQRTSQTSSTRMEPIVGIRGTADLRVECRESSSWLERCENGANRSFKFFGDVERVKGRSNGELTCRQLQGVQIARSEFETIAFRGCSKCRTFKRPTRRTEPENPRTRLVRDVLGLISDPATKINHVVRGCEAELPQKLSTTLPWVRPRLVSHPSELGATLVWAILPLRRTTVVAFANGRASGLVSRQRGVQTLS